jgi:hypothetical protein
MRAHLAAVVVSVFLSSAASVRAQGPHCPPPAPDVEPNGTLALASPIGLPPLGTPLAIPSNGTIDPPGDVDYFRIGLQAGQRLWILVDTSVPSLGSRDSFVRVLAADGTVLAQDDDDGTALDLSTFTVVSEDASAIAGLAVPASGDYFIEVTAANPADRLRYRMYTAVSTGASSAEIEPNDTFPVQPFGDETVLGQIGPGDVDLYHADVLDNGLRMVLADGAVDVSLPVDLAFHLDAFPVLEVDSSSFGGAEAIMLPEFGNIVRVTGSPLFPGTSPYRLGVFYIGDTCGLPVTLQSFAVE